MSSKVSTATPLGPLPSGLSSMWRALKRAHEAEPRLLAVSFSLALLAAVPDAVLALLIKVLADALQRSDRTMLVVAAVGLGVSSAATWFLRVISDRTQRRFRDRVSVALEAHVAKLQATVATIAHQERPEIRDRLAMLRDQVFVLDHMYMSLFTTCGWILRLGIAVGLLMSVHPALGALAFFALPAVYTSAWRPGVERAVTEKVAHHDRLARHLFEVATTASPGKEVRVTRIGELLTRERRAAWQRGYEPVAAARWVTAVWHTLGWLIFGAAYVAAVVYTSSRPGASAGSVLLVLAAGSRLSAYVSGAVGEIGFLRGFWMEGSMRLAWLEEYAAEVEESAATAAPTRIADGIRFEQVSFSYPGTDRLALEDVNLELRAGTVVAVVGENGAGKSTLVKLLCKMYQPTEGRIWIDGTDLATIRAEDWRERSAGAFQDFYKFELKSRSTVGLGDLPNSEAPAKVGVAVDRAGATDVIEKLAEGLETQLGPAWPGGVEVSFGQWQKLALARGFMREGPLLLVLDEPTAALDAETEHALFERYAEAARASAATGRITILVSHRFSTVRMADHIVVLDGARVAEHGSHEELMAKGGQYSSLYNIQAAAYR